MHALQSPAGASLPHAAHAAPRRRWQGPASSRRHPPARRYLAFLFDTVYIKHICNTIPMTDWGRVYYTNLLSLVPLLPAWLALGEYKQLRTMDWSLGTTLILALSCLVGLCMSHAAYMLRRVVSATAMALVRAAARWARSSPRCCRDSRAPSHGSELNVRHCCRRWASSARS
jgi:hypothetical protein